MTGQGSTGNVIAAVCSFFVPGLGQLVQAQILKALFFFVVCGVLYTLSVVTLGLTWILGALFHLWAIVDAATFRPQIPG